MHDFFPGGSAEWAALYAAGALTDEERTHFEAHLSAGCPTCQAELEELGPVVAELAAAIEPVTPPPRLRESLLKRVGANQPGPVAASPLRRHLRAASGETAPTLLIRRAAEDTWEESDIPGVRVRVLFNDPAHNQFTALVRMAPGTSYPRHIHDGPEECLVLEGDLRVGDEVLGAGDYQRAPAGSCHGVQSTDGGCLLLITSSLTDVFI